MKRLSHARTFDFAESNQDEPHKPARKPTQQEQDEVDDHERRKALKELVGSWNDRLQLISLITTFMASVEAGLLQVTAPDSDSSSQLLDASNACLFSALIIHLHASFISFVAAFFLIRFKVKEAKREEDKIEGILHTQQPGKGDALLAPEYSALDRPNSC